MYAAEAGRVECCRLLLVGSEKWVLVAVVGERRWSGGRPIPGLRVSPSGLGGSGSMQTVVP